MSDAIFNNRKLNINKLIPFGFTKNNDQHIYLGNIANDQFQMVVTITKDGKINTQVLDLASDEE
ncbi:hypothetical protein [Zophobihabitans entericus]|uniref:hypothetical protein n=1 Tax=Zophobihabitans entericus TaxID=1635327 RepID=UPI001AB00265|nr:hypothetical protein [Zophobihabitans entericus]